MSGRCLEGVWRVSKGYLEGIGKISGRCLEDIQKVSGGNLEFARKVTRKSQDSVWRLSGTCLESIKIILLVRIILGCSADTVSITCLSLKILIFATKLATTCRS